MPPRYTIHTINSAALDGYDEPVLAFTDSHEASKELAAQHSTSIYGACIVDHLTGDVDYGCDPDCSPLAVSETRAHRHGS